MACPGVAIQISIQDWLEDATTVPIDADEVVTQIERIRVGASRATSGLVTVWLRTARKAAAALLGYRTDT